MPDSKKYCSSSDMTAEATFPVTASIPHFEAASLHLTLNIMMRNFEHIVNLTEV